MKKILCAALLGALAQGAMAADVGVSISIGDPNFYGRLDIGNFPRPVLMYPQPVVIQPVPYGVVRQPLYLRVPPGHARDWRKHCRHYGACGVPVYFVQDRWYRDVYAPRYRAEHGHPGGRYDERHDRRDDRFDDRRDRRDARFDDRHERRGFDERGGGRGGPGNGHGGGHGGGHGRHD